MKKSKLFILPILLGGLTLVGCGNTDTGGNTTGKVTITFDSQFGNDMEGRLRAYTEAFNKERREKYGGDIEVIYNKVSGNYNTVFQHEKSEINGQTNQQGDIVTCYPDHIPDYISLGKAVKLDKFIDDPNPEIGLTDAQKADYVAPAAEEFDIEYPRPGTFTMPWAVSTEAMYYNEKVLNLILPGVNNGEPINEDYLNSLTWEELFGNLCPKILEYNESLPDTDKLIATKDGKGGTQTHAVFGYSSDDNLFITMLEQYGYPYTSVDNATHLGSFDFNNAQVKQLMKDLRSYKQNHYLLTDGANGDSSISDLMGTKQLLFCVASTGGATYQIKAAESGSFVIGVARVPQAAGKPTKLISQGGSFCILSHTTKDNEQRQLAAWKFYKYLLKINNCASWATQTGYAPLLESVKSSESWISYISTDGKSGAQLLKARIATYFSKYTENLFTSPVFKGSSEARVQAGGIVKQVLSETTLSDDDLNEIFADAINNCKLAQK